MTDLNKLRSEFEIGFSEHLIERDANGFYINDEIQNGWEKHLLKAEIKGLKEQLEKAKAQAVPEWISVKDSMPEEGEEVVIHHYGHVVQATKDKNYVGGFKQRNCYGWESVSTYVSHWIPKNFKLPETFCMYYTDEHPYKETLASESGAEG